MGLPKCRLDVWNPTIGGTTYARWVTAQNPENQNAVTSIFILDKLANSRTANVVLSNRANNFTSTGAFDYHYQDNEGNNLISGDGFELSDNRGVLTNIFQDFMQVRLVDEATNQVLFSGRIFDVDEAYDARLGSTLKLQMRDSLDELSTVSVKGLLETIEFYPHGASGNNIISNSHAGHSITDMVKAYIACAYKKEYLPFKTTKDVTGVEISSLAAKTVTTDELIADTVYDPTNYVANIVTDDSSSVEYLSRFQDETTPVSSPRKIDFKKTANRGLLGEILRTFQTAPQESQQNNKDFGWDYYVDPNISYKEHANFKGKNLLPTAPPPPDMFNAFKRGKRVYNIEPATYGLSVKYRAENAVDSQGHSTDESTNPDTVQYATKPMSHEFDFTRPKDKLYSSLVLKYTDKSGKSSKNIGVEREIVLHILYVTNITGQFKYGTMSGTGISAYVAPTYLEDFWYMGDAEPAVTSPEYVSLYASNGTTLIQANVARIQYQSDTTISGSTNYGYILVSHLEKNLLTRTAGNYVLKGAGDGEGGNASAVRCDLNLNTTIASNGFPRRVWGVDRQHTVSRGSVTNLHSLRQEAAALLSRSSTEIVDGAFAFSGPPMYHYDAEIRAVSSVTGGQTIQIRNAGGTANVILSWYGFRNGMLVAKMNSSYSAIETTAVTVNGVSVQKDVYGYVWDRSVGEVWSITLSEGQSFSVGDKIRFFVPLRAGDTIRVENVLSNVAGNHLIKEIEYTEEPNQMTRLKTTGVNEGIGLDGVRFAALLAGSRDESDLRLNIPAGHQPALWTGLFSAVDNNTVQWQTVGGEADIIIGDGSVYAIDTATANNSNTTHATNEDAVGNVFGIANAAHPAAGNDTIYYIYVDPNTESIVAGEKSHFYTRPATSPASGSDAVYTQDGDNIIVGWMKAGATADDLAEFGVYRDAHPGDGKRNAALVTHPGTATSALLKKGAQTFTTDLMIEASQWDNDDAYKEVKWHGGEKSDGSQDTDNATIKLADGTTRTIAYGGDSGDSGGGQYIYHNGTNYDDSPLSAFAVNNTYYAFIDFVINPTGNMILQWTNVSTIPYGDDRILLAIIVVPPNATKGRSPVIIPLTTKSLSINAVAIAANSITGDHVQANTIATSHISGIIEGAKVTISAETTFASPTYNPSSKTQTFVTGSTSSPPTSISAGDLWINPTNNDIYIAAIAGADAITAGEWVLENDAKTSATAAQATATSAAGTATTANNAAVAAQLAADGRTTLFYGSSTPTSNAVNDIWFHDNQSTIKLSTVADSANPAHWVPRDDANAINNALTSINGGLIKTQRIQLLKGGSTADAIKTTITATTDTLRDLNDSNGISTSDTTIVIDASTTSTTNRRLTGAMTNAVTDTTLDVATQSGYTEILVEDIIKVDTEEMLVTAIVTGTTRYTVVRGWRGTTIAAHITSGNPSVYPYVHKYTSEFIMASDVIRMDSEDMYVNSSNATGTSFEVTRAWNGTTAASHLNNVNVFKYNYSIIGMTDPHIIMDYGGIVGYSDAFTPEFSISSEDGKAMFGGGVGLIDENGIHLRQQSGATSRLRFETSSGGELSSIYTNQGTGNTDYTHWFTKYDGTPSTNGKEIHIGSGPDNINSTSTPQTKAIVLNAQYIGIHPDSRSFSSGPIYYRFPDDTPSSGDFLKYSGSTFTPSITGSTVTAYDLEWAAGGGGEDNENSFKYISRSGTGSGSTITAQHDTDTIEFVGGTNMSLAYGGSTTNPTITFNATGGGGAMDDFRFTGSSGGNETVTDGELITFSGTNGIATSRSGLTLTISGAALASSGHNHSGTYDNYNYWTLQGDSGSNDSITSTEVVDIRGANGIATTVETNGLLIDGAGLSLSGHTHSYATDNFKYWDINNADSGFSWGTSGLTASGYYDTLYLIAGDGIELRSDISGSYTPALRITATGGHDHNSGTTTTTGNIYCYGNIYDGNDDETYIKLSDTYIQFYVDDAGTSRRVIDIDAYDGYNKGHMAISGVTSTTYSLKIHAAARAYQTYASSSWSHGSDERVKTNITSITGAVDTLKNINPVSYTWTEPYINATGIPDRTYLGFVAQEYEQVFPDDVQESINDLIQLEDGSYALDEYSPKNDHHDPMPDGATMIMENMKTIAPDAMVPYLVAAVKELAARIEVLEGNE